MASSNVAPPEKFSFKPEEWPKWIRRFELFRVASELNKKPENTQISTLIYSMGDEADDILSSFTMSDDDREKYDAVEAKFEGHFIIKRNIIFERAKFNLRLQKEGESADNFITDLYTLAEHCQFGTLHDELIRDRIVVGLRDKALSEKLQLESSLTLEKAINQAKPKELIRQQQEIIRPQESPVNVDRINVKGQNKQSLFKQKQYSKSDQSTVDQNCGRCGGPPHKRMNCPARDSVCIMCKKKGHWKMVCRSKKVNEVLTDDDMEELFLGEVIDAVEANQSNSWKADIAINDKIIKFKIDSGADVSVLPYDVYNKLKKQTELELEPTNKGLSGPCNYKLNCIGKFKAKLSTNHKSVDNEVFVVKGLQRPLLYWICLLLVFLISVGVELPLCL